MNDSRGEIRKLSEALILCQRELAQVREQHEPLYEQCARERAESVAARANSAELSRALARHLSRTFWEQQQPTVRISWRRFIGSRWSWLHRWFGTRRSEEEFAELEQVRLLEASSLFDGAWYLRRYADVASAGVNPALHYLRTGAREGRDPGPEFNTLAYVSEHPELADGSSNPLVHKFRSDVQRQ